MKQKTRKKRRTLKEDRSLVAGLDEKRLLFIDHVQELRRRFFFIALSVCLFSIVGYSIQQYLVHFLLKPAGSQHFIYTSPGGGLSFLFQVCIYFGIALSIPVIVYQSLKFIEPLLQFRTKRVVARYSFLSGVLALSGASFGYFVGLPVALGFLGHQFTSQQIQPLLTIQSYLSFVTIYIVGLALLFQIPLIMLFINRIKPLSPRKLLSFERYMIVVAFVAAAIMTPTTDILNMFLFAAPMIAMYQLAVIMVFFKNRRLGSTGLGLQEPLQVSRVEVKPTAKVRQKTTPRLIFDISPGPLPSSTKLDA